MTEAILEAQAVTDPPPLAPVSAPERLSVLDALRGFAIFGILLVNMGSYAHPFEVRYAPLADYSRWDEVASFTIRLFADGKFYALFSFLFGVGMALQESRAAAAGRDFRSHQGRRLGILVGIGLVHGLLIWAGDILLMYALVGFALLLLRGLSQRALKLIAGAGFLFPLVTCGLFAGVWSVLLPAMKRAPVKGGRDFVTEMNRGIEQAYVAYQGGFGEVSVRRITDWMQQQSASGFGTAPQLLALFVVGLLIGRSGVFSAPAGHEGRIRQLQLRGLLIGLLVNVAYALFAASSENLMLDPGMLFASMTTLFVGGPLLAMGYATTFLRAYQRASPPALLRALEPVGRMAITNYLLQSVICTTLFYGYGLGLYGKVYPAAQLALTVALFAFQVIGSHLWLQRFRFGPVEWLWRSLTYGRRQPMRRLQPIA